MRLRAVWKVVLVLGALFGCAVSIFVFIQLIPRPVFQASAPPYSGKNKGYVYHFAVIMPEMDSFYWKSFEQGAFAFARQNNIALEFHAPRFTNVKEEELFLEFAVLSKVDGIVTGVPEEKEFYPLIKQAGDWGIPVVTLDSLASPPSKYVQYVGIDPFEYGEKAGEALAKARHEQANIAVLIRPLRSSSSYNEILRGLSSALKKYPFMRLSLILDSNNGMISAEERTYDILMNHPEIDTIFCTNEEDTEGATQVVVDLNRVDDITIVGSGLTPEIARYIERGVIYGTLSADPFNLGFRSIAVLKALKDGVPMDLNTEISFITSENLGYFGRDYPLSGLALK